MDLVRPRQLGVRIACSLASAAAMTIVANAFYYAREGTAVTAALTLTFAILGFAIIWGMPEAVSAAVAGALLLNYYFIPPLLSFKVSTMNSAIDLAAFLATAIVAGNLSARARRSADQAILRQKELEVLNLRLTESRQKAEGLLLNILPAEIAKELEVNGAVMPRYFEDVTVMFTDFVGFTKSAEKLAAEELVTVLDDYFTAFDQIVARYGIEKMKTVGDSYMCIGGVPSRNPSHAVDMVLAALEMLNFVGTQPNRNLPVSWSMRVGIHCGPVVAGVVGTSKFAFDVWGDTVNLSSRMESSGVPNRVNVSDRTLARIKDFFVCEPRGRILTKGEREVEMHLVEGVLPRLREPDEFARRYQAYFQKRLPQGEIVALTKVADAAG
jgi:class 3 adenylate cyclase